MSATLNSLYIPHNQLPSYSEVLGCGDMTPPDGAWMTRDGDVIEIGCHSGSKTWRLECKVNQWVGSVGICGKSKFQTGKEQFAK